MRALGAVEMLKVWEEGLSRSALQRSLMLLAEASEDPAESVATLTVGQRDARLLMLREWAFGTDMAAVASCPLCAERLEFNFRTVDAKAELPLESGNDLPLEAAGYQVRWRAPNSLDLIAIADERQPAMARRQLLQRCISTALRDGAPVGFDELPPDVLDAVVERIAQSDPQGDMQIPLNCLACGYQWQASLDIGPFFCNEIHTWAERTLRDVHTLASAYGWREMDILALSPWRRQFYLECIHPLH